MKLLTSSRSILLKSKQMGSPSAAAARIARSVPTITPSTASTTSSTPSARRSAAQISSLKLIWPAMRAEGREARAYIHHASDSLAS